MLDECIPERVVHALRAVAQRDGLEIHSVVDEEMRSVEDPIWIAAARTLGCAAMVSGDARILQNWPKLLAVAECGLISFFPPASFSRFKAPAQAAMLLRWWPAIEAKIQQSQPGNRWRWPDSWTPDVTHFKALRDPRVDG
jgi:hypothetical protein